MESKPKTLRGNYILFRYLADGDELVIEIKDRTGKFWYCKLVDGRFEVVTVVVESLFDEIGINKIINIKDI